MTLRRALDALYAIAGVLGALAVAFICVLMLAQVASRQLGLLLRGADDLTAWACASAAFLPLAYTFKRGELVRVGLWIDKLRPAMRHWVEVVALAVAALFALYCAYWMGNLAYESWSFGDRGQGLLPWPLWIPQVGPALGAAILAIALIDELAIVLAGAKPTYQRAEEARRAAGDFSAEV